MLSLRPWPEEAPSPLLAMAEAARASFEVSSLTFAWPLLAGAPSGDGHDVVVLPGFALGEASTLILRRYLAGLGYRVHDWGLGRNHGAATVGDDDERLAERISEISDDGQQKVSLVGHSLGGVVARRYALRHPDRVRQVICLGSPFVGDPRAVNPVVLRLHDHLAGRPSKPPTSLSPERLATPFTAIFSRSDGVVAPSDTTAAPGPQSENIEVYSSHTGLVGHPAVLYAVADRLAQPTDRWTPFRPAGWISALYGPGGRPSI